MIEAWVYFIIIAPAVVIVLTVVFVGLSRQSGRRIKRMRQEAAELRRRSLDATIRSSHGQATAHYGPDLGSEAYQRAVARSRVTY